MEKNYKKLQRKYPLAKVVLVKINELISKKPSDQEVAKWLSDYDNVVFSVVSFLDIIEGKESNDSI